jgi:hypothetical protein
VATQLRTLQTLENYVIKKFVADLKIKPAGEENTVTIIYSSLVNVSILNGRLCTTIQQAVDHHHTRSNPREKADLKVKVSAI